MMNKSKIDSFNISKLKILIVEDDVGLSRLIEKRVKTLGCEVKVLNTGRDAINFLKINPDYLVILDYELSDMTGEVLIKNLQNKNIYFNFIAITGHGNETIAVQLMKLGALDYLIKDSFFLDLLPSTIRKIVSNLETKTKLDFSLVELEKSELLWKYALEGGGDGVWDYNYNRKKIFISKRLREIIEKDIAEIDLNLNLWKNIVHPEDISLVQTSLNDHIIDKTDQIYCEFRIIAGNGEKWLLARGKKFFNNQKSDTIRIIGTVSDISEKKKNQEKIRKYNEEQLFLLNNIETMVWYIKDHNTIGTVNKALTEYFNLEKKNIEFKKIVEVFPQNFAQDLLSKINEVYLSKSKISFEHNYKDLNNQEKILAITLSPKLNTFSNVELIIATASDITDTKKMEKEMLKIDKLESLSLLAGGIAHDFNNILTGILANLSLSMMHSERNSKILPRLKEAEKACNRASNLTNQLLTFAKGGAPVRKLSNLKELIYDTAVFALRGSSIRLDCEIAKDLYHCNVDSGQISQVINNLVLNARQAMPNGGKIILKAINIDKPEEILKLPSYENVNMPKIMDKYIKISIEDQGIGIPKEFLTKIYDPFFTTKQTGNGLGLSTCFKIIQNHDGYMNVESELGKGTVFQILIPASNDNLIDTSPSNRNITNRTGAAIIIEHDLDIRNALENILKELGWKTISFDFWNESFKKVERFTESNRNQIFLVFLDFIESKQNDIIAVKDKILTFNPNAKIVLSCQQKGIKILSNYHQQGFFSYLIKPYSLEDITDVIKKLI